MKILICNQIVLCYSLNIPCKIFHSHLYILSTSNQNQQSMFFHRYFMKVIKTQKLHISQLCCTKISGKVFGFSSTDWIPVKNFEYLVSFYFGLVLI